MLSEVKNIAGFENRILDPHKPLALQREYPGLQNKNFFLFFFWLSMIKILFASGSGSTRAMVESLENEGEGTGYEGRR